MTLEVALLVNSKVAALVTRRAGSSVAVLNLAFETVNNAGAHVANLAEQRRINWLTGRRGARSRNRNWNRNLRVRIRIRIIRWS